MNMLRITEKICRLFYNFSPMLVILPYTHLLCFELFIIYNLLTINIFGITKEFIYNILPFLKLSWPTYNHLFLLELFTLYHLIIMNVLGLTQRFMQNMLQFSNNL